MIRVTLDNGRAYAAPDEAQPGDEVEVFEQGWWPGAEGRTYRATIAHRGTEYDGEVRRVTAMWRGGEQLYPPAPAPPPAPAEPKPVLTDEEWLELYGCRAVTKLGSQCRNGGWAPPKSDEPRLCHTHRARSRGGHNHFDDRDARDDCPACGAAVAREGGDRVG